MFSKKNEEASQIDDLETSFMTNNNANNKDNSSKNLTIVTNHIDSPDILSENTNISRKRHKPIIKNSKISKRFSSEETNKILLTSKEKKVMGFNLTEPNKFSKTNITNLEDKALTCKRFTLDSDGKNMTKGSVKYIKFNFV